jgi:hypothetical protein
MASSAGVSGLFDVCWIVPARAQALRRGSSAFPAKIGTGEGSQFAGEYPRKIFQLSISPLVVLPTKNMHRNKFVYATIFPRFFFGSLIHQFVDATKMVQNQFSTP